jgi:hypothetical protein
VELVVVLLAFVLLAAVVAVIGAPLRASFERPPDADIAAVEGRSAAYSLERAELEAERETKYREIRDAELDFRTGKLSREDYASLDATLRAEALAVLDRLEALGAPPNRAGSNSEAEG